MSAFHDLIVIGGGHNGLVTAAYAARAGLKVLVLERREVLGGACVTEEVWPGWRSWRGSFARSEPTGAPQWKFSPAPPIRFWTAGSNPRR